MGDTPHSLDLTGEICPYTFVRTKLALEELPAGALIAITVDHPPARDSVPKAAREEGHEVVSVEEAPPGWVITLRKGSRQ